MKPGVIIGALVAVAMVIGVSGCSVLEWAGVGSGSSMKPMPDAESAFNRGESLFEAGKYRDAREAYSEVKEHDPERFFDPLVQIRMGDSYYEEASYQEAEVEYGRFLELRPSNKAAPYVKYQMGMCNYKQMGSANRDPAPARNAARHFGELLKNYPGSPYEDEAAEKLRIATGRVAQNEYSVGYYYYRIGKYTAAVGRLANVRKEYPGCTVEPEALYYLADSYIRLNDFDNARQTLAILYQEYPNHELTEDARADLAPEIP